jgi:hypothetical protein
MPSVLKPGQIAPISGQIQESGSETEKTIIRGNRVPPTSKPGNIYVIVDVTKHKAR